MAGKVNIDTSENYLNIELFGKQHKFKTNLEMKKANEVARLLTKEVYSVQGDFIDGSSEENQIAVLIVSALNLAKKNIELMNLNSELKTAVENRSKNLIKMLDHGLLQNDEKIQP